MTKEAMAGHAQLREDSPKAFAGTALWSEACRLLPST